MSDQQPPTDPVLSHVQPVPGGLYGYEAALSDLRAAVAEVSAALSGTEDPAVTAGRAQRPAGGRR
ncbi:hypothetical protein [Streptomyces sp. NPDC005486]|uniref:hypothetical protein n=1 Tax=Streptomyces sp. NPDC005486 TaxID=3155345 RepID=UPI0033A92ADE